MKRPLSAANINQLVAAYTPFHKARATYRYELDWSSDIAIPPSAIEASYERMMNSWHALVAVVDELDLRTTPASELAWPNRIPGGAARISGLRAWMNADGHRKAGPES